MGVRRASAPRPGAFAGIKRHRRHAKPGLGWSFLSRSYIIARMSSLGRRIALGRKGRNMTQKQLADHFNIRPAAVSQWENDQTRPDSGRLAQVAKVLGSTVEYLETG